MIVVPAFATPGQHFHHRIAVGGVEIAGGLIGENHLWVRHQRARDGDALLLAAGELLRHVLRAMRETHSLQRRGHALATLGAGQRR